VSGLLRRGTAFAGRLEAADWRFLLAVTAIGSVAGVVAALAGAYVVAFAAITLALGAAAFLSGPAACVVIVLTSPLVSVGAAPIGFHFLLVYPLIAAGVAGAVWRAGWRGLRLGPADVLLIAFVAIAVIVSMANAGRVPDAPVIGATGANAHDVRSIAQLSAVLAMAAIYLLFRASLRTPAQLFAVVRAFLVAGAGVTLYAAYQVAGRWLDLPYTFVNERRPATTLPVDGYIRVNSTLPEASPLAQFSAALLLLGLVWCTTRARPAWLSRRTAYAVALVAAGVLAATLSKAGWLATFLVIPPLLVFTVPRRRLPLVLVATLVITGTAAAGLLSTRGSGDLPTGGSDIVASEKYVRMGYWIAAIDIAEANPFGVGIGNYAFHYPDNAPLSAEYEYLPGIADAHNIFLEMFAETGLLGGLLFAGFVLALMVSVARSAWRARRRDPFLSRTALALTAAFAAGCLMHLTYSYFYYPFEWVIAGLCACAGAILSGRGATAR
jgi:hypothetical protein